MPSASVVVSDIIECINNFGVPKKACWKDSKNSDILTNFEDFETSFYVRTQRDKTEKFFVTGKIKTKNFDKYIKYVKTLNKSDFKVISKIMALEN